MDNILWLSEINEEHINLVGEKALKLSMLYKKGFPMPQAFIITNNCFKGFLENNNIKRKIYSLLLNLNVNNFKLLQIKVKEINEIIKKAEFSEKLKAEILENYSHMDADHELLKKTSRTVLDIIRTGRSLPYAALRSSMISKEYNHITYLNVRGISSLIANIKNIWGYFFNFDSIYYRNKNNISHDVNVSIIMQKMINSEKSGIVYYDNGIRIESLYGMFEYLGNNSKDYYLVDDNLYIKEKKINNKNLYLTRDEFGNSARKILDEDKKNSQVLSDDDIKKLSEYYKRLKEFYKKDIRFEFAVENSKIYILDVKEN